MSMTLQEMRDFVREHLDIGAEDLPDLVLDRFIREGSTRIDRTNVHWPFRQSLATVDTNAGWAFLTQESISARLDKLVLLQYAGDGRLQYVGTNAFTTLDSTRTGKPSHYTLWGEFVLLWPTPDQVYTITSLHYLKGIDWVSDGSGASPDMPEELHGTIATWALARAYAQQEDPELAALYFQQFQEELDTYQRTISEMPLMQPMVLNGGSTPTLNGPRLDWM